ncbi:fumarylacetoacetate hydrolase family protein [Glaciihabitans sp. UYNi722]|uniref:fumarylacetoacetate hydrolase family protein n=1 Tax=Glaciihabitans sp. UYNi722 TaxID=3156344 RepID=UPI003392CF11
MRIANLSGRAVLLGATKALDIAVASEGAFGPDSQSVWDSWSAFIAWAMPIEVDSNPAAEGYSQSDLAAPVARPSQIFAVGLNYADHASEADMVLPENPLVFTKFPSSLTGPNATVTLSSDHVDWEAELVVVIGNGGRNIPKSDGWSAVAGLTVGQDLSDRTVQSWGAPAAQFALGKSFAGYSPTGPAVVTTDEIGATGHLNSLDITCSVVDPEGGEPRILQNGNTRDLIFSVPDLVARLSAVVELRPGDLIFTGTPSGVGMGHKPPQFLKVGQRLTTTIEGVGTITQTLKA